MSRQIQIRRGTAAEHTAFTGAVGEVTMDTDANTLRVHDGATAGGVPLARLSDVPPVLPNIDFGALETLAAQMAGADYVVEKSAPGANPWYRKYKSGWVEQGGKVTNLSLSITSNNAELLTAALPVTMTSSDYVAQVTVWLPQSGTATGFHPGGTRTFTNQIQAYVANRSSSAFTLTGWMWKVEGMAAA